jgi:protoheme IX farnesyltransferase
MQRVFTLTFKERAKAYCSLIKPGIIMGNAITAAGGFSLASRGHFDFALFLTMLAGLCLIIGSACVCNNYIDRDADRKMSRTQNRVLTRGIISSWSAVAFASVLGIFGTLLLVFQVDLMAAATALFGFVVYVFFYSFLKYHSTHGTLIGSVAGAVPPVVGYSAASNCLDMGAFLMFVLIVLWQMPHFFAIAIFRLEEYANAKIPVLPLVRGIRAAKIQMLCYVIAFAICSLSLTVFDFTGVVYGVAAAVVGLAWIWLCIKGFKAVDDKLWARKMFLFSLIAITVLNAIIPFST